MYYARAGVTLNPDWEERQAHAIAAREARKRARQEERQQREPE